MRPERTKRLYQWGDIDEAEYRVTKDELSPWLRAFTPETENREQVERLKQYLTELPQAWEDATQEQRNRLLKVLVGAVWVRNKEVRVDVARR